MSEEREEITEETAPLPLKMQEAPAPIQESENKAQTDTFNFTEAVLMAVCTNSRLEQEKRVTDMSALLHILEAANGTTPPKTKEAVIVTNAVRMSKELNSIDQIFFESDRMHLTDKTRKAFCDYLGYEVFRGGEECLKN